MKRKLSKIYTYKLLLIATLVVLLFKQPLSNEITPSPTAPLKVIDGDSLEIGTTRIRLMGIDAPEYLQYCKNAKNEEYPCGKESKQFLENLIKNKKLKCISLKQDQYNRELCNCYADEINLNAEMVRSGQALVYLESDYHQEQNEAKQTKRGIWRGKFMHPRLYRRLKEMEKSK